MKKTLSLVMAIVMMLSVAYTGVTSADAKSTPKVYKTDSFKYTVSGKNATIKKYIGKKSDVKIPSKIKGYKVTEIGTKAFSGVYNLKTVKFPSTLKTIGSYAFSSCVNLENITIPSNVRTIKKAAFFSCRRAKTLKMENGVTTLEAGAFYNCLELTTANIPSSVRNVGDYIFGDCILLKNLTISNGIPKISRMMFRNCLSLKNITIPSSVTKIERKAFEKLNEYDFCKSQGSGTPPSFTGKAVIEIPSSVKSIGEKAFQYFGKISTIELNCENICADLFTSCDIDNVILGKNVKKISKNAFTRCIINKQLVIPSGVSVIDASSFIETEISDVTVDKSSPYFTEVDGVVFSKDMKTLVYYPKNIERKEYKVSDTVEKIGPYAFNNNYNLQKIDLPENLKVIGDSAFLACDQVKEFNLPESVTSIGENAFDSCGTIRSITLPKGIKTIEKGAFASAGIEIITIPDTVESISDDAFKDCENLKTINLPSSVKEVSPNAFSRHLKTITVDENSKYFTVKDNVLFTKNMKKLVYYLQSNKSETYKIPTGTTVIGGYAFTGNEKLKSVGIPSSVYNIGKCAFDTVKKLKNVTIPNSVTYVGQKAFGYSEEKEVKNYYVVSKSDAVHKYCKNNNVANFTSTPKSVTSSKSIKGDKSFTFSIPFADKKDVTYTLSKQGVLKLASSGKVTGVKKGTCNVYATIGNVIYKCKVTVTTDAKKTKVKKHSIKGYFTFTEKNYQKWMDDYFKYNKNVKQNYKDFPSIHRYTTQQYKPMFALAAPQCYAKDAEDIYGKDYDNYRLFFNGLKAELGRYKLHTDTVVYSGTETVCEYTGKTNSIKDMKACIGKTIKNPAMVSTTISEAVSNSYAGETTNATILEIYVPKDTVVAGYVSKVSYYPDSEYELLIASDTKYKVIDAGYRTRKLKAYNGDEETVVRQRYMKLQIVK